jgi:ribosomal protein S18 acetylase RimI-like enzyme
MPDARPPDHGPTTIRLDLADPDVASAVLALQRESYAIEAALIGDERIPMLIETIDELRSAGLEWLGVIDDAGLTGAVSWKVLDDGTVDIHRLVVAPRAFRRGVASALLDALDVAYPDRVMVVSTGTANAPALRLYGRRGFHATSVREVIPGLSITELERQPGPPGA